MDSSSSFKSIKSHFKNASNLQQSCKIHISAVDNRTWSFYFKSGHLIWATSSEHRFRRLYRLIQKHAVDIDCEKIKLREREISELWEYLFLKVLLDRQQIDVDRAIEIVKEITVEILFDCAQAEKKIDGIKCFFETAANHVGGILRSQLLKNPIAQIDAKQIMAQTQCLWDDWQQAKLTNYSPNLAPTICNHRKLTKILAPEIYKNLFTLIDGKKTLRDIFAIVEEDSTSFTSSLIYHLKIGAIELRQIEDIAIDNLWFTKANSQREQIKESNLPLAICLDDNPQICRQITQILNPAGYRLIAMNDSTQVLTAILDNKPDLIFLNWIMPVVNGYELCSQIRKMPGFKKLPIIMLSDRDSAIDRFKAKMHGASEFVAKPIDKQEILVIAEKYIPSIPRQKVTNSSLIFSQRST